MKVLHIFKEEPDELVKAILEEQKKIAEVIEMRLYEEPVDYERLIEIIEVTDRLFTW